MSKPHFDREHWRDRLRSAGLRATGSRLNILRSLHDSPSPMTVQEVFESVGRSARADRVTVYRTLNSLVDAGIAHRVDPGDRTWRFGLLATDHEHHAHFICDDCGTIRCLENATIRVSMKGRPSPERFRVTQRDVYLHGTCQSCLDKDVKPRGPRPGRGGRTT